MSSGRIAYRYAKALFRVAERNKKVDRILEDMKSLGEWLKKEELKKLAETPIIGTARKKEIFEKLMSEIFDPLTVSFVDFVLSKNRESLLALMALSFEEIYRQHYGIIPVTLKIAIDPDDKLLNQIRSHITRLTDSETFSLEVHTDESLIGGFVLLIDDKLMDASISGLLERMRSRLEA